MMNKIKRPRFYAAMAVATVMLLGSCDAIADFLGSGPMADILGLGTDESADKSVDESADGGGGDGTPVAASDVSFANSNIWIRIGENFNLASTITPANAAVSWSSDTPVAASVSDLGIVSGLSAGTTKITVTPTYGGKAAVVSVQVVDFTKPINISANWQWDAVFAAISRAPEGASADSPAVYKLNITMGFSVAGRTTPNITGIYKRVELTDPGAGNKVTLSSPGSIIQTEENQTYIFDGPAFVGINGNNRSVVHLDSGSAELKKGTISGNTTIYNGGGVYVGSSGAFTMSGGTITGNIARGELGGGGVWVNASGTFEKTGGTINGEDTANTITHTGSSTNTATNSANPGQNGHAVALYSSSKLFYRNGTLGPTDSLTTEEVTESNLTAKRFEGVR